MSLGNKAIQSRFLKWGFTGKEAEEFGNNFSYDAIRKCSYLRKMIQDRQRILANAKQYKWDTDQILNAIRRSYQRKGLSRNYRNISNIWKLFRWYEDNQVKITGQVYETPRRKQKPKDFIESPKSTTSDKRRQMLKDRIDLLNRNIKSVKDESARQHYISERDGIQRQLDNLK